MSRDDALLMSAFACVVLAALLLSMSVVLLLWNLIYAPTDSLYLSIGTGGIVCYVAYRVIVRYGKIT